MKDPRTGSSDAGMPLIPLLAGIINKIKVDQGSALPLLMGLMKQLDSGGKEWNCNLSSERRHMATRVPEILRIQRLSKI